MSRKKRDQQYRKKWISIQNFLSNNTGYTIHGIARAGSRRQGGWSLDSDMDIRLALARNSSRREIYPDLKLKLETGFPGTTIRIGSSYNVIKMRINALKFDIVLLPIVKFEHQVQCDRLERIQ